METMKFIPYWTGGIILLDNTNESVGQRYDIPDILALIAAPLCHAYRNTLHEMLT